MRKIICDKCGKEAKDNPPLFECFDGSLGISNFDLCDNCLTKFQKMIDKFTKWEVK